MKSTDIVEAWKWRDPGEMIERLLRDSERLARGPTREKLSLNVVVVVVRDRYYTLARKCHVKQLMRGKR